MPSRALRIWQTSSRARLEEFEYAHALVAGRPGKPGRRFATEQLNHAYLVAVAAHFQRFCRDLRTEAVRHFVSVLPTRLMRDIVAASLVENRMLNRGNANNGSLGSDFKRIGVRIATRLDDFGERMTQRRLRLEILNDWRNAIVHQDTSRMKSLGRKPILKGVRRWRNDCDHLASALDSLVGKRLTEIVAFPPWN